MGPCRANVRRQEAGTARRREKDEECGHNKGMARLEAYNEGTRDRALLFKAAVGDGLLFFKVLFDLADAVCVSPRRPSLADMPCCVWQGLSLSLSGRTTLDPPRSVLPERAIDYTVGRRSEGAIHPQQTFFAETTNKH